MWRDIFKKERNKWVGIVLRIVLWIRVIYVKKIGSGVNGVRVGGFVLTGVRFSGFERFWEVGKWVVLWRSLDVEEYFR